MASEFFPNHGIIDPKDISRVQATPVKASTETTYRWLGKVVLVVNDHGMHCEAIRGKDTTSACVAATIIALIEELHARGQLALVLDPENDLDDSALFEALKEMARVPF